MTDTATTDYRPLADRLRPDRIETISGQDHILAEGKILRQAIDSGQLHSLVFWGPPGTGKTTIARLLASYSDAEFIAISAVLSGVKEIRAAIELASQNKQLGRKTLLFVDEVHRFNKSQQDAFLPHIENGTIIFIGATTENPSFELNNALLSRLKVYVLKALDAEAIEQVLKRAIDYYGTQSQSIVIDEDLLYVLAHAADGDARRALNLFEVAVDLASDDNDGKIIDENIIKDATAQTLRRFDKGGDIFYDQISALHKSVRGSNPDASLYWLSRMLDGGCDPRYIARRVVRMASEDIGNADPRALTIALDAWETYERLGSPEGELAIAQAVAYMASTAKSNAVYMAFKLAMKDAKDTSFDVPMHIRNAPTRMMKDMGYGKDYRYAHDEEDAFAAGETYFPDEMDEQIYYNPVERGLEVKIAEKLRQLRDKNRAHRSKKVIKK